MKKLFQSCFPTFKNKVAISCIKQKTIFGTQYQLNYNNLKLDIPLKVKIKIESGKKKSFIYLWTKKVMGEGAQRKVKKCYDLLNGRVVIRKKICSNNEKLLLQHFQTRPAPAGIEPIKSIEDNKYIIQELFPGTLSQLIKNNNLNFKKVGSIMHQLAIGLTSLHDLTVTDSTKKKLNAFHSDIKPDNILIRKSAISGNWEVFLSDFGIASNYSPGNGTIGYLPPEDVKLKSKVYPKGINNSRSSAIGEDEMIDSVNSYGQKKDVWALGLVFLHLISNNFYVITLKKPDNTVLQKGVSSLRCVTEAVRKGVEQGHPSYFDKIRNGHPDFLVGELTQEEVNQDILQEKINSKKEYAPIFDKLLPLMLQVDPTKRITAQEVSSICLKLQGFTMNEQNPR